MRVFVERRGLGVVAAITPWNVPFMTAVEYGAPALAMGNAYILKPAESVPRAAGLLERAFLAAGWPDGAVTVLRGGPLTGRLLSCRPELGALCFTGSSDVGRALAEAGGMHRLVAELGGNGPTIVFDDADVDFAADCILQSTLFLSGQSCAATERVLVQKHIHDTLIEAIVERAGEQVLGDPRDPVTTLGPLHLRAGADKVDRHIADALDRGARRLEGSSAPGGFPTRNYVEMAVLDGVSPDMLVFQEETFGPVVPVTTFSDDLQALELANGTRYGLSSAVFSEDVQRALSIAKRLSAPHVVINRPSTYWEMHLPWGGGPGTDSGMGRLGGRHALFELSGSKTTALAMHK
jgi:succinate-semialdehyde dehydrogenase/glutarate-semialdehyde dehydrogenase